MSIAIKNTDVYLNALERTIQYKGIRKEISDSYWDTNVTPLLYPLWDSAKDKLEVFLVKADGSYHITRNKYKRDFKTETSSWVSYSCNYCHHWSCSGHHHGHFYGHGYFHHGHHHNSYNYGYHDGFHDGYWWGYDDGYDDGWSDNGDNGGGYGDSGDDRIERRDNSYNSEGDDDIVNDNSEEDIDDDLNSLSISNRDLIIDSTISNVDTVYNASMMYNRKKYIDDSSSSTISYETIIERERERERKPKTKKRNSGAFDLAKILFSTISSSSKGSRKDKSSASKSKGSKKDKSSKDKELETSNKDMQKRQRKNNQKSKK